MATGYYYNQDSSHDHYYNSPYNGNNYQSTPPVLSFHFCLFLLTIFFCLGMSWYLSYESVVESVMDQLRILLILSPLLFLLAVHFLSNGSDRGRVPFVGSTLPERESFHQAGASPWGVGLVLVLLLFMISYQSSFQERWFPLLRRRS